MSKIIIIGINQTIGAPAAADLQNCRCAFATGRLQDFLADFSGPVYPISPLSAALTKMSRELNNGDVAVLAGGDPLFFGIGRRLIDRFGSKRVKIIPALSALQLACARFNVPWDDCRLISLHGRNSTNFSARIIGAAKSIILTDKNHSPAMIAESLLRDLAEIDADQQYIQMMVAENLGSAEERLTWGSPTEIIEQDFSDLNIVLIRNQIAADLPARYFGLREDDIQHSRGLITKDEVRAATLHHLRLPATGVFWDLGAGSGSISVETARLCPILTVFAVEKKPEEQENIRQNIRRFKLLNLELIAGEAPAAIAALPDPQRIFIGGSGGQLAAIIEQSVPRLAASGIIVINAVTTATAETAPALLHAQGLTVEISVIQVSRRSFPPDDAPIRTLKPITIITGKK